MRQKTSDGTIGAGVNRVASGAHRAVDSVADAATGAADDVSSKGAQVRDSQENWIAPVRDYVNENPLKSLGVAIAGGYVVGRLLQGWKAGDSNGSGK